MLGPRSSSEHIRSEKWTASCRGEQGVSVSSSERDRLLAAAAAVLVNMFIHGSFPFSLCLLSFALWFWNQTCTTRMSSPVSLEILSLSAKSGRGEEWYTDFSTLSCWAVMKVRTRLLLSLTGDLGDSAFGDEGFDSPAKYNIIIAVLKNGWRNRTINEQTRNK